MLLLDRRLKGRFFVQSLCTRVGASLSLEVLGVQNSLALSPEKKEAPTKAAELAMLHRAVPLDRCLPAWPGSRGVREKRTWMGTRRRV